MKKFIRVLVPLLLAVLIIASIGWYLFTYDRGFTRDFLLTQARYNDLHGNSRLSSWFPDKNRSAQRETAPCPRFISRTIRLPPSPSGLRVLSRNDMEDSPFNSDSM